jgi:PhnB protein
MPIIPHLIVHDGLKALDWYEQALGATRGSVTLSPDGTQVFHGTLYVDGSEMFVCDDFGQGTGTAPGKLKGTSVFLVLECSDADAALARAEQVGAKVLMRVADTFWGSRYGQFEDPFGHIWELNQAVRQVGTEEMQQGTAEHFNKT